VRAADYRIQTRHRRRNLDVRTAIPAARSTGTGGGDRIAMPLLEARNLTKRFGGLVAVDNVSLAIEPLTVTALIGPNGAGKTTFFKMLAGEEHPTSGDVYFKDHRITNLSMTRVSRLGIAKSFQI